MKRFLSLIMLFSALCLNCFALSETSILLHHGEEVKVYDGPNMLNTVLQDAQEGDTVYLGKGTYGGFSITKKIYVYGTGNGQSLINGDVIIEIDEEDIIYEKPILVGLQITGNIRLYGDIKGITIQQCYCAQSLKNESNDQTDVTLDRCWIREICYSNRLHDTKFYNCKILYFNLNENAPYDCVIQNCNIYAIGNYTDRFRGTINNSIIGLPNRTDDGWDYSFKLMTMYNCILGYNFKVESSVLEENIYKFSDVKDLIDSQSLDCKFTNEELKEKNMLGTDGSVIGCYGGSTPYTLSLALPTVDVKNSTFDVNNSQKTLNVKINLVGTKKSEDNK